MRDFFNIEKIRVVTVTLLLFAVTWPLTYTARAEALLQVGAEPVSFTLKDTAGQEVSLAQFSDKKAVVLVFWSTWSARSKKALKRFEDYYKKYKDKGVQVIGINADKQVISEEDLIAVKEVIAEIDITFPVLIDQNLKTFHSYHTIALPSTIVISEGKIAYELAGLPLVGTEDMFDYLLVLAGEKARKEVKAGYIPAHDAIANASLARKFVKKKINMMAYSKFKKSIEADPKYMLPYVEMAKLYRSENKNQEAEEILLKAFSVEPENAVIMTELGYLYSKTGKNDKALEILQKAVSKNGYTPSHYYYAYALSKAGKTEESFNSFKEALSLNPFTPETYLLRAEVYEESRNLKEATSDYRKALELILGIH